MLAAASIALLPAGLAAQSVLIDFNSSITANLTQGAENIGGTSGNSAGSWSESGGIGGSGAFTPPPKFKDSYGYTTKTAFASDFTTARASAFFYVPSSWEAGTSLVLDLGFVNNATVAVGTGKDGSNATDYGTVGLPTNATTTTAANSGKASDSLITALRFANGANENAGKISANFAPYNNVGTTGIGGSSTSAFLAFDSWYKMETVFTRNPENDQILIMAYLFASDANGNTSGTALVTYTGSGTVTNTALTGSENIYGYIGSQNGTRRGVSVVDNLSFSAVAVPEPATAAAILAGLALAIGFLVRRRR